MAAKAFGPAKDEQIIVYCGAEGYASAWWFVLTQILGYHDVKFYDGSIEAWTAGNRPLEK